MGFIRVKDKNGLYRDESNNAIINMDQNEYQHYVQNYKKKYNEVQKIKNLENDVSEIKNDLNEIKNLLRGLANES
jgi:hypothetical protein